MSEISSLDIARFAFHKREARFVLTKAAAAYAVASTAVGALALAASWPHVSALAGWYIEALSVLSEGGEPGLPPTDVLYAFGPIGLVAGLVGWVLFAAFEAACLRWLVRSEKGGGLWGIGAGADTWRVFAVHWIWLGLGLAGAVAVAAFYLLMRAFAGLHPIAQMLAILVGVLAPLGIFASLIWFSVRLSPAAALSIARGKLSFFGAWEVTRGRFWNLLGAFVIAGAAYLLVATIVGGLMRIPIDQAMAPIMADVMRGGANGVAVLDRLRETLFTPLYIALFAFYAVVTRVIAIVFYVAWFGINASATVQPDAASSE